ncbi:MAG TPA: hypothetical protein VM537_12260, partial [Anaerolineae bacterium]|nr:hypothetical protein [Anaerolineae bacterium]
MAPKPKAEQQTLEAEAAVASSDKMISDQVPRVNWEKLRQPTPPDAVKWLPKQLNSERQRALLFPYVDAVHVLRALDEACGSGGWHFEVLRE